MQMYVATTACLLSGSWISTVSACCWKKIDGLWLVTAKICSGNVLTHLSLKNVKKRESVSY